MSFLKIQYLYTSEKYDEILSGENIFLSDNAAYLHNLGNAAFKKYEQDQENFENLYLAKIYYEISLEISDNSDTQFNLDIVNNLLNPSGSSSSDEEISEEEIKNQGEENNENTDSNNSRENSENQEQSNNNAPQINARNSEYKLEENQEISEISEQEQQELEQKLESLEQEQQYNQQFYNKQPQKSDFGTIFENFWMGKFNESEEKDW